MQQRFDVQGMSCAHCAKAITQAVHRVDPGARVEVDLAGAAVTVDSDAARERLAPVMAMARMRPVLTCGSAASGLVHMSCSCPAIKSVSAGLAPL